MIGFAFTNVTTFGVSSGPTYQGQTVVPAVLLGTETYRNPSGQILQGGGNITIDASGFLIANWLALGWIMQLDPVQTGAPTPAQLLAATVTIRLVGTTPDYDIILGVGQAWAQQAVGGVPGVLPAEMALITTDCTSILVVPDANCDCDVYGLLGLSA